MNLDFGINGDIKAEAARPIIVQSTTPIGLLAVATKEFGLHKFNNAEAGLKFLSDNAINGDVVNSLKAINLQGVNCPIVLNLCAADKVLDAMDLFTKSGALTGVELFGGMLIAPVLSAVQANGAKLDAVASKLMATALIDNFDDSEAKVINWAKNYGTRDSQLVFGKYTADGVTVTASALFAGLYAYWDAKPFGYTKSHSNRVVKGVSAAERIIEYLDGQDCEARRMRQKSVATIVNDIGWRSYGYETTHIDPIWQSLDRVRTFKRFLRAIMTAIKYARDREANELLFVKDSITTFMNEMKGNDVIIGFSAVFDPLKNTKATVSAGKFYLTVKMGDMPSVRELNIELIYSDSWNDTLINFINGNG